MQAAGINHIRNLIQFPEHAAEDLQVIDFNIHIDGSQLLFGVTATGHAKHVHFFVGKDSGDIAQQAATIVCHHADDQRVACGVAFSPDRVNDTLRSVRLQLSQLIAVRPVNGNPPPLGDETDNLVAWNRLTAAGDVVHQVAHALHHDATVVFAAILRRPGFLLQLFQRRRILLFGARLIKLRLQEVDHLVKADISAANGRQQLIQLIEVVARQQMLLCLLEANPQVLKLIIKNLPPGENILVAILLAEPGVDFGTSAAGRDIAEVWVQPVAAWVWLFLGNDLQSDRPFAADR